MKKSDCLYKAVCGEKCFDTCIRYLEMKYLIEQGEIPMPAQFQKPLSAPDEDYDAYCVLDDIRQNIVNFVSNGENLYIYSQNTGNGKTTWSMKLLLKYFDRVWVGNGFRVRGLFVHVPTLLIRLKNFENPLSNEYKLKLNYADLIVWDDIASTELSNYDVSLLLMYLDMRIMNGKANIFTGNITNERTLDKIVGTRLASRIWNKSKKVCFVGKDKRGEQ